MNTFTGAWLAHTSPSNSSQGPRDADALFLPQPLEVQDMSTADKLERLSPGIFAGMLTMFPQPDGDYYRKKDVDALLAALASARPSVPQTDQEPVLWQYRWTNPACDPEPLAVMLEWKPVDVWMATQTLEQRIEELRAFQYKGKPSYEVRALYAAPPEPQAELALSLSPSPSARPTDQEPVAISACKLSLLALCALDKSGLHPNFIRDIDMAIELNRIALAAPPEPQPAPEAGLPESISHAIKELREAEWEAGFNRNETRTAYAEHWAAQLEKHIRAALAAPEVDGHMALDARRYRFLRENAIDIATFAFFVDDEVEAHIDAQIAALTQSVHQAPALRLEGSADGEGA